MDQSKDSKSRVPLPSGRKGPGSRNRSSLVIIIVLIVIIVVLASLYIPKYYATTPVGSTASSVLATSSATVGLPYNLTIETNGRFTNTQVNFGNGPIATYYSQGKNLQLSHVFEYPGSYFIYYTVNFSGNIYNNSNKLISVLVSEPSNYSSSDNALGLITVAGGSAPEINNTLIYKPESSLNLLIGYFTPPSNKSFQVVSQALSVYRNGLPYLMDSFPYYFNSSAGVYALPTKDSVVNLSSLSWGIYSFSLTTYTANVGSNGTVNVTSGIYQTTYVSDIAVFAHAGLYQAQSSANSLLVNAELQQGGYVSLDPQIEFDTVSEEINLNTYLTLVYYNGSNDHSYVPMLAAYLPSIENGGINTNYENYTVHDPWGTSYTTHIEPYENYTFHIRSNATWQNGQPVTAWDVEYSMARLLLFMDGSPGTSGYLVGQFYLPGVYYNSISFWNITQNMTVNNQTNNFTIHFQYPVSPQLAFQVLSYFWPVDPSWLSAHGAGITWTPTGFNAYEIYGDASSYNTYIQNHAFSDGPYIISYNEPGSQIVLTANPNYNPPGPWFPKPSINEVIIQYVGEGSSTYLELESGSAQMAGIPLTEWSGLTSLENQGKINVYGFPSGTIEFFNFNGQINTGMLSTIVPGSNVPSGIFYNLNIRKAFAYAFDYSYYYGYEVGNALYNTTFMLPSAGTLPSGISDNQSIAQLNASGAQVPYYNLTLARIYWGKFQNSTQFSSLGFSVSSSGTVLYNGKPLNIPIFVFAGNPSEEDAGITLGSDLQKVISGFQYEVVPIDLTELVGYLVPGSNPLPMYIWSNTAVYTNPTYELLEDAMPTNSSYYPYVNSFLPYQLSNSSNPWSNVTEASILSNMIQMYNNGFNNLTNPQSAKVWFQKMNEELVNLTLYIYLGQPYYHWIVSSKLNGNAIVQYEENSIISGGGDMYYNLLTYSKAP
ncbi:MAG: ABC transporter substrate-binding protein [Candidatus Thermoplasmatota archaeon]|nr:ABC transporter substrate-binding protein [Candidatus Thermoplasmatota archaeon]